MQSQRDPAFAHPTLSERQASPSTISSPTSIRKVSETIRSKNRMLTGPGGATPGRHAIRSFFAMQWRILNGQLRLQDIASSAIDRLAQSVRDSGPPGRCPEAIKIAEPSKYLN
jgi:hypothetical protein